MTIYECDMCGRRVASEHELDVVRVRRRCNGGAGPGSYTDSVEVCADCAVEIGEFVSGYKNRQKGLRCSLDTTFGNNESAGVK